MLTAAMITNAKMVAIVATNLVTTHAMILAMTSVQKSLKTATAMRNARAESLQTAQTRTPTPSAHLAVIAAKGMNLVRLRQNRPLATQPTTMP